MLVYCLILYFTVLVLAVSFNVNSPVWGGSRLHGQSNPEDRTGNESTGFVHHVNIQSKTILDPTFSNTLSGVLYAIVHSFLSACHQAGVPPRDLLLQYLP